MISPAIMTPAEEIVWYYVNPITSTGPLKQGDPVPSGPAGSTNNVFRAYRYTPDYPGFAGKSMTPGNPLELYTVIPVIHPILIKLFVITLGCLIVRQVRQVRQV